MRVYDRHALSAVANIPKLWRGEHPLRGMHDWFATHIRMTFSRPVPLQIGGDAVGTRQTIEFRHYVRRGNDRRCSTGAGWIARRASSAEVRRRLAKERRPKDDVSDPRD